MLALAALGAAAPASTFDEGVALYEQQRYQEALGVFLKILSTDPSDPPALDYEGRCIDALFEQRADAALFAGAAILREAMSLQERSRIAAGLALEGRQRLDDDDPIAAEGLYLQALDMDRSLPAAVTGLSQADALARWQLREGYQERSASEQYALKFALRGIIQFNAGHYADAAPSMQQSLFLLDAAAPEYPTVSQLLLRAKAGVRSAPIKTAAPLAQESDEVIEVPMGAPPARKAPAAASHVVLPPPLPAPAETSQPAMTAAASPEAAAIAAGPVRDSGRSGELYLQAVTSYLTGKRDEALDELKQALQLDPDNTRAKKLQDRILLENAAQNAPSGEQAQ